VAVRNIDRGTMIRKRVRIGAQASHETDDAPKDLISGGNISSGSHWSARSYFD
jgi:hypothetical protein